MSSEVTSRWLTMRWLALGGAAGAAVSLSLQYTGIEGPWQTTALLFVSAAMNPSPVSFVSRLNFA